MGRASILENIKAGITGSVEEPLLPKFNHEEDVILRFVEESNKSSTVIECIQGDEIDSFIDEKRASHHILADLRNGNIDSPRPSDLEYVIVKGQLGVAENGAVWLDEEDLGQRIYPFITQHLVITLNKENIVANMHEAYERIQVDRTGFGVFIAGPSKTADIEQSLVIGAHGARTLTLFIQ